jgi:hypothetical protein
MSLADNIAASRPERPLVNGYQIGSAPLTNTIVTYSSYYSVPIPFKSLTHSLTHSDKETLREEIVDGIEGFLTPNGRPRNKTEAVWFLAYATTYFFMVTPNTRVTSPTLTIRHSRWLSWFSSPG